MTRAIVIGQGQLGAKFSEGFLKAGSTVVPVLRGEDASKKAQREKEDLVLVSVGEDDLAPCLSALPSSWNESLVLLQNELRPDQWEGRDSPSIAIVWFEKKAGKLPHVVLPSVLYGRHAPRLAEALNKVGLPHRTIEDEAELAAELVIKNLYILGLNLGGLQAGETAGELLSEHAAVFWPLMEEILEFELASLRQGPAPFSKLKLDPELLKRGLVAAIDADPGHGCKGRSAPQRLERTLNQADKLGLKVPLLRKLRESVS